MKTHRKGKRKGAEATYITRTAALRKLQLSLKDFKKLCILKGIYPREPKNKFRGKDKTYYLYKDIVWISHDPIIRKLREWRAIKKHIKKAKEKDDPLKAKNLKLHAKKYTLDHVVKDRYPTFMDALQDLDDPLSMIALFANMSESAKVKQHRIENCARLYREWLGYVVKAHALRKVFVSIKGVYFQAEVMGQTITWLAPHEFRQKQNAKKIDYSVMLNFLEFYETLLGFVLFKLYDSLGLHYPPLLSKKDTYLGRDLEALLSKIDFQLKNPHQNKDKSNPNEKKKPNELQKQFEARIRTLDPSKLLELERRANEKEKMKQLAIDTAPQTTDEEQETEFEQVFGKEVLTKDLYKTLFKDQKFYVGREVPHYVDFIIHCFGGKVLREHPEHPNLETDPSITIQVVDRDVKHRILSRTYVQPQWIFDSVNELKLLPVHEYTPGVVLPPHLSPFVNDEEEGYTPSRREKLDLLQDVVSMHTIIEEDQDENNEEIDEEEQGELNQKDQVENEMEKRFIEEVNAELEGKPFSMSTEQPTKNINKKESRKKGKSETPLTLSLLSNNKRRIYHILKKKIIAKQARNEKLLRKRKYYEEKEKAQKKSKND